MPTKKNPQPTRGFMRSVFHANEDGTTRQAEVPVHLDPDSAIFGIVLPTYMVEALELKSPVITANNIDGVCQQYEAISDEYSRWRLSIGAETPLTVKPRIDYKPGARVKVQLKAGEKKGNVVEVFTKTTGPFIRVNFGTKDMPIVKDVRPVKVKGF